VLYETAIDSSRWSEAMQLCAHYVGGISAHMLTIDKQLNQPVFSAHGGVNVTQDNEADYVNHYIHLDPRIKLMESLAVQDWWLCVDNFDREFVNRSEFYQDFFIPNSARYSMGACVDVNAGRHTVIGIMRTVDQSQFCNTERICAQRFSLHLQRALRLQTHTQSLQAQAELGYRAIDALALAMLIVDNQANILHLNSLAENLLNNPANGFRSKAGRLSATQSVCSSCLDGLIARATGYPAVAGAMMLGGVEPRQVFITPLPAISPFAKEWQIPLALVLVMDPAKLLSPLQLLGKLYDLSPAELRVASALLDGKSPEEFGQEAFLSLNTVRTQLKSLFRKTGTHRQSELVALLSRAPPLSV